jgi:hypothetical protein
MGASPNTLTVVMLDDSVRVTELAHLNDVATPIRRRTVHIPLTEAQMKAIAPKPSEASHDGLPHYESIGEAWLEYRAGAES